MQHLKTKNCILPDRIFLSMNCKSEFSLLQLFSRQDNQERDADDWESYNNSS